MSNKEQVLSRCKAVVQSGGKCPESGVYVYWHMDFYELCYDGGKLCINADGTGEGFEAAAKWLGLHSPWRLTSEELPEEGKELLCEWVFDDDSPLKPCKAFVIYIEGHWLDSDYLWNGEDSSSGMYENKPPFKWMYVPE